MKSPSSISERDRQLIADALKGNQKAYEQLFSHYRNAVFHLVQKIVKREEDAEDLMYVAFAKAFQNLDKYEPTHSFATWLFRIASNASIDFLRKKTAEGMGVVVSSGNGLVESVTERLESTQLSPEEKVIREQRHHMIHHLVDQLEPDLARVIKLRFFEEYSYDEISAALHLPLGTVKTQIHRARKALFQFLKEKPGQF